MELFGIGLEFKVSPILHFKVVLSSDFQEGESVFNGSTTFADEVTAVMDSSCLISRIASTGSHYCGQETQLSAAEMPLGRSTIGNGF